MHAHKPSESEKTSETMTKSSRHGDDGLGCGVTADVQGENDEDCDEASFTSAAGPLALTDAFN